MGDFKSSTPRYQIYLFFLFHMLFFGVSGFALAYAVERCPVLFLYLHGGSALFGYTIFYLYIFGADEIKWMFINAGLGVLGIYTQVGWLLSFYGKKIGDYPLSVHVIPFLYYVFYTFLLRQALLDITGARDNAARRELVHRVYVGVSLTVSLVSFWLAPR